MKEGFLTLRPCEARYEDRKSVFLAMGARADSESDALDLLEKRRVQMPDASHHIYAWRLGMPSAPRERFSDDREPKGTAGLPALYAMRGAGVTSAVIIVTRYFGGALLGTGGLTRAYGAAAKLICKPQNIIGMKWCGRVLITIDYVFLGKAQYYIAQRNYHVESIEYADNVRLTLVIWAEETESLSRSVADITSGAATVETVDEFYHHLENDTDSGIV
ncbi:MAG: YigZ family protein [Clostridiales bacterium]|jgi:uncharacterized YigZ family protein|nr:YigZ family protein [Clostridiales bacterium]